MRAYFINLDAQPERRAQLEAQLDEIGLAATRIKAVTPADISAERLARYCSGFGPWHLSPPELACTLSHARALEAIAAAEAPFGLVLEDDAILSRSLRKFLDAYETAAPAIDVLKLDSFREQVWVTGRAPTSIGDVALREVVGLRVGATGYVVSRSAAARIVAHRRLLEAPIDISLYHPLLFVRRGMIVRHADPALCTQHLSRDDSHLQPARSSARRPVGVRGMVIRLRRGLQKRGLQLHGGLSVLFGRAAEKRRIALPLDVIVLPQAQPDAPPGI